MARKINLDMTGVESYAKASEGRHTAKVTEILEKTSQAGDPMLQFTFEVTKGDDKGCRVFESFVLTDKALWKLKAFLVSIGVKADGKIRLDLDKLIGKICDIEVFWDEYNGQTRAKISDYYKPKITPPEDEDDYDDADDEEYEEEAPAPAPKDKRGRKAKQPDPDPDEDDEDEDEAPAPKKAPAKSKKSPVKSEPEEDDEDEDEEEEKPAPKSRKKAPAKTAPKKAKKPAPPEEDDDEDDDDDQWEEDD